MKQNNQLWSKALPCTFNGCTNLQHGKGLCNGHLAQQRKGYQRPLTKDQEPKVCTLDFCDKPHKSLGYCATHYYHYRNNNELKEIKTFRLKGTGSHVEGGYILLYGHKNHPNSRKSGAIFEHVLVMSQHLGRALYPGENVHHKNGVTSDNRIENLELWVTTQPSGQRPEDLVQWAKEILKRYDQT